MFARYAAIVKNLRGVVLFDLSEDGAWESVEWLVKRFRYRDLGLPPSVYKRYPDKLEKYMGGNPFRLLTYPLQELEAFAQEFAKCLNADYEVAELLTLSSIYISPAMIVGKRFEPVVGRFSVEVVKTCKELGLEDWKLHMRIADYTVLDMYESSISSALSVIETCSERSLEDVLSQRIESIRKDVKRYWRILCNDAQAKPFLYYIDNLRLYTQTCELKSLCGRSNVAAALATIPVIAIPPGMK
ncbi:MAG: hypothetical protein JHC33_13440 [Ignisphaera sp.]|nr:hypothetical protein [Ignisphaera sp.]